MQFIEYPKCSTCKKAKAWLQTRNISFLDRNITTEIPTKNELDKWITKFNIPISKLFNTSGIKYRELGLKEKLSKMSQEDKISLLTSDGMLIKRPLLVSESKILIGFKEKEWEEYLIRE